MNEQKITDKKLFAHNNFEKYNFYSRQTPLPISNRSVNRRFRQVKDPNLYLKIILYHIFF